MWLYASVNGLDKENKSEFLSLTKKSTCLKCVNLVENVWMRLRIEMSRRTLVLLSFVASHFN